MYFHRNQQFKSWHLILSHNMQQIRCTMHILGHFYTVLKHFITITTIFLSNHCFLLANLYLVQIFINFSVLDCYFVIFRPAILSYLTVLCNFGKHVFITMVISLATNSFSLATGSFLAKYLLFWTG